MDAGREARPRLASVLAKATWNQQYVQVPTFARLFLMDMSSSLLINGEGGEWTPEGLAIMGVMALPHIPYVWSHKYPPWGHKPPKQLRQQSEARHRHDACRSFSRISSTGRSRRKRRVCNLCLRMQSRRHILRPDQRGRRSPSAIAHALIEKKLFSFMGAPT